MITKEMKIWKEIFIFVKAYKQLRVRPDEVW